MLVIKLEQIQESTLQNYVHFIESKITINDFNSAELTQLGKQDSGEELIMLIGLILLSMAELYKIPCSWIWESFLKTVYSFQMEACLAESLEIVQGLDRKRDFKSEFKANLKELKSTRKFKKNKKEQIEKLKGKSLN